MTPSRQMLLLPIWQAGDSKRPEEGVKGGSKDSWTNLRNGKWAEAGGLGM